MVIREMCEVCKEEKQEGYKLDDLDVCLSCYSSEVDNGHERVKDFEMMRDLK